VPGSPDSLPTLETLLGLPNRVVAEEEEEEDLGRAGFFGHPPALRMFSRPLQMPLSLVGRSVCCL
jgi:hypothetical protein